MVGSANEPSITIELVKNSELVVFLASVRPRSLKSWFSIRVHEVSGDKELILDFKHIKDNRCVFTNFESKRYHDLKRVTKVYK